MCEGRTHVAAGYPWGVVLASALHLPPAAQLTAGVITAGASALNDLDCKGASAARVLGPVSGGLSWMVRRYAAAVYGLTRGDGDPVDAGEHRKATHAVPVLLLVQTPLLLAAPHLVALGAGWVWSDRVGTLAGAGFVASVVGFCLLMVLDRLGSRFLAAAAVLALGVSGVLAGVDLADPTGVWHAFLEALPGAVAALWALAPWVVLLVLAGAVCHVVFDEITEGGTPLGAPLVTRKTKTGKRRRWVMIRLPEWVAIETGGWFERRVLYPVCLVVCVLVTPVIGPLLLGAAAPWLPGPVITVIGALQ